MPGYRLFSRLKRGDSVVVFLDRKDSSTPSLDRRDSSVVFLEGEDSATVSLDSRDSSVDSSNSFTLPVLIPVLSTWYSCPKHRT